MNPSPTLYLRRVIADDYARLNELLYRIARGENQLWPEYDELENALEVKRAILRGLRDSRMRHKDGDPQPTNRNAEQIRNEEHFRPPALPGQPYLREDDEDLDR